MLILKGYKVEEQIYTGEKSYVYRGDKSGKPVIIKVLRNDYPLPAELNFFRREYEILESLNSPGIVRAIGLEKYNNSLAIVFEDIGGYDLYRCLKDFRSYTQLELLKILINSAKALGEVHRLNLVHRDIKPQNIILNKDGKIQIIDFGNATELTKQNSYTPLNSSIEGTLSYISPEQTGRMNRSVDYRTDYYSLGITFYQVLTGELPFSSFDSMELVHAHIAKIPVSPFEKNGTLKPISDIVMKLLQKNPEDRYQSITGLIYDLEWCASNIEKINFTSKQGVDFQIGKHDFSMKFQIPEKLYGREKEIKILLDSYEKIATKDEKGLILIAGHSGMGKSALIQELHKPITKNKGYFLLGKFDQYKRDIPYSAIIAAFAGLIKLFLSESNQSIEVWKKNILNSLGSNAGIMTALIPELELIIGKQELPAILGPVEEQTRFNYIIKNFIRVCANKEHPIVIFLDDMQWADNASLNLLKTLYSDESIFNLLIICSYRDNEVDLVHPFSLLLEDFKKEKLHYDYIKIFPLGTEHLGQMILDTVFSEPTKVLELARITQSKTGGNPFFVTEFLKTLYKEDLLLLPEPGDRKWRWDAEKIQSFKVSENIVDLLIDKIQKLSHDSVSMMKIASCIGAQFKIETLIIASRKSERDILKDLMEAINEGLLIVGVDNFKFAHDKVREATYSIMDKNEKEQNHYRIGKLILENTPNELIEDEIFDIIGQLNLGLNLIETLEERLFVINLNLIAGKKAKKSTAYNSALGFLRLAISLLPADHWSSYYSLSLEIYRELSECEYLSTHFLEADKIYQIIFENSKTMLDKIPTIHIKLRQKATEGKGDEAFQLGFSILTELGLKMPDPSNSNEVNQAFAAQLELYKQLLTEREILDLFKLHEMTDENAKEAISLVTNLGDIAIVLRADLLGLMSIMGVVLSIQFGNAKESPISYVMWGVITNIVFRDYRTGYEFGQLGLKINQYKFPSDAILGKCLAFYGWNIHHWVNPCKEDMDIAKKGYELTMKNSDIVYAGYFVIMLPKVSFYIANPLEQVIDYCNKAVVFGEKHKYFFVYSMVIATLRTALALEGKTDSPTSFSGAGFSEEKYLEECASAAQGIAYYYMRKFQLHYIFGEFRDCLKLFPSIDQTFYAIPRHIVYAELQFYGALAILSLMHEFGEDEKKLYQPRLEEAFSFIKMWSGLSSENFAHQYLLLEAEKARIDGRSDEAMQFYDKAIASANQQNFIQNAAIANELAAKFYLSKGLEKIASLYINDAHYLYKIWGAEAKVKQLENLYSGLIKQTNKYSIENAPQSIEATTVKINSVESGLTLDLETVMKSSQTIGKEIQLDRLLEKMIGILIENAGAERGVFILKEKESWLIKAEGDVGKERVSVLEGRTLGDNSNISVSIVNYVIRTKSIVLLPDASEKGIFVNDQYVKKNKPKSILCYPIINYGKLVGVVYLENNLTSEAFTPDRLEILNLLSSQIAVSVENSMLYESLEEKVEERTEDLNRALQEVRNLLNEVRFLKEQQDGDYFLNTLLIEPLAQNNANSKSVEVDFFIKQKKRFMFRSEEYELGGDVNISENIELQGNKYIVFLNGDAMGKSIQGAGGVLVLGTVFKTILQRTLSSVQEKAVYPEKWLKNAFVQMHKAFESFDGTMLMSIVFGLVEERTGTMYFMNADHPDIVLYRDGVASFIDNSHKYTKLGTQGQVGHVGVKVFSLLAGDKIIIGSDGRDDIIIGKDPEEGYDIINQDERLFLLHVQNGEADLPKIYESINQSGKLMDDFSLLKIHYKGFEKEYEKLSLEVTLKLLSEYKENRELDKFLELGERLISDYPHLTQYIYEMSNIYKEKKQMDKAEEYTQRIKMREPSLYFNITG